jgi:RNA polymerase sigma-70 factor (ECF subfamily)
VCEAGVTAGQGIACDEDSGGRGKAGPGICSALPVGGLAEDLTAESFVAAVHAVRKPGAPDPSIPWLIGVARHKLADHWRRIEREQRGLRLLDREPADVEDPWETVVDRLRAREVLDRLGAHHRAALTLRYLDGLPVPEVAGHLDRTLHATEALLVRARAAFRQIYEAEEGSR